MSPNADQYANALDRANGELPFTGSEDLAYLVIAAIALLAIGLILWKQQA